jgi:tetratricopeptide (TPR) repeat protein
MKKNKNLAIFLFFAALVQIYVFYSYYQKSKENDRREATRLSSDAFEKFSEGKFESAVLIYSKIIDIDSKDSSALLFRGLAYQGLQKYDESIADFETLIDYNPNKADDLNSLFGESYFYKGEFETAKKYLRLAIEKKEKRPKIYTMLGSILIREGNKGKGCEAFEEAIRRSSKTAADSLKKYCN